MQESEEPTEPRKETFLIDSSEFLYILLFFSKNKCKTETGQCPALRLQVNPEFNVQRISIYVQILQRSSLYPANVKQRETRPQGDNRLYNWYPLSTKLCLGTNIQL